MDPGNAEDELGKHRRDQFIAGHRVNTHIHTLVDGKVGSTKPPASMLLRDWKKPRHTKNQDRGQTVTPALPAAPPAHPTPGGCSPKPAQLCHEVKTWHLD